MDVDATTVPPPTTAATWWDALPAVDQADGDSEFITRAPEHAVPGISRRRFVQVGMALGGALALNALQALSGVRLKPASATVGSEYTNCAGYDGAPGYNNNSLVCVGAPYSYIYCGSDGWFKNGYFDSGTTQYWPILLCGYPYRNAWRWPHGPYRYRCADGRFRYKRNGVWTTSVFRICSQWIGYT